MPSQYTIMKKARSIGLLVIILSTILLTHACRKDKDPFGKYRGQPPLETTYQDVALVTFTDKQSATYSLQKPATFLSARALERRSKQQLQLDASDLPVSPEYIAAACKAVNGRLLHTSRWMNFAVIHLPVGKSVKDFPQLPFIKEVRAWGSYLPEEQVTIPGNDQAGNDNTGKTYGSDTLNNLPVTAQGYGRTYDLLKMHNAMPLHKAGYRGKGKMIAVLASGFGYMKEKAAYAHLFKEQRITATYDFVTNTPDVFNSADAGTYTTGIMGAILPGEYVGLAPEASFALLRVDANATEEPIDESSWIAALEYADSLGVDIVNSSSVFGMYFDDPAFNIRPEDANGKTAMCSRAADKAVEKGMLVIQMINTGGSGARKMIAPPADAFNVITAGNVRTYNGKVFDSWYALNVPTADGRHKPELAALSHSIPILNFYEEATDWAYSPAIISGLSACLWQALPAKSAMEMRNILLRSSNRAAAPDNIQGHGVTDFQKAWETYR